MLAVDFVTVETVWLQRLRVLFFMEVGSCCVLLMQRELRLLNRPTPQGVGNLRPALGGEFQPALKARGCGFAA